MRHLKYFEAIDPDDTFDRNGKFIFIGEIANQYTYRFVWNLRLIKKTYECDSIGFTYRKVFNEIKLDDINEKETFQFNIKESRIEPIKFYESFPEVCILLYNEVKKKLDNFPSMSSYRVIRYKKLLDTLYGIDGLRMAVEVDKYNL